MRREEGNDRAARVPTTLETDGRDEVADASRLEVPALDAHALAHLHAARRGAAHYSSGQGKAVHGRRVRACTCVRADAGRERFDAAAQEEEEEEEEAHGGGRRVQRTVSV